MNRLISAGAITLWLSVLPLTPSVQAQTAATAAGRMPTEVHGGSVSFEVRTNVLSTKVRGDSDAVDARAVVTDTAEGVKVEQIVATVPVASLRTGLKKRDEHMREYIFQTESGQLPDVTFAAEAVDCVNSGAKQPASCLASGVLTIRGSARPVTIALTVTRDTDGFRVGGTGTILLSAFGIERPTQFGVRTDDEVHIQLALRVRRSARTSLSAANLP